MSAPTTTAVRRTPAPAVDAPAGRAYVRLVLVLGSLIAIGPLTIDMYLPALPTLAQDLSATDAQVQGTLTGVLVGIALGQLVLGPVTDAVGRRPVLLAGLLAHAATSVAAALVTTVPALVGVRVLQGAAGAAVSVVAMAVVRDLFSGRAAATLLSRLMLVMGVAPVLAPSLGGGLLAVTSWRGIFAVLGTAAVLLAVVAARGLPETLPPHRRRSARPSATARTYARLLRDVPFVVLAVVSGLVFGSLFTYVSGSSFVLQGAYGMSEQAFAVAFGLNAVGLVLATQLNPVLLRRYSPAQVLTGSLVVGVVASATLVAAAATGAFGLWGVVVPLWFAVGACGLSFPNTPALALSRHGEAAGTAAALLGASQFGIGGLGAPLVGVVGTSSALPMAVIMLTATATALVLLLLVVRRVADADAPAEVAAAH